MPEQETPPVEEGGTSTSSSTGSEPTTVPLAVLKEERKARQKLEKQLAEISQAEEQRKQNEMSELEKAQKRAEKLEKQLEAERQERIRESRTALVQSHAAKAGFADPEDAVAFLSPRLSDLEDSESIEAAVKELAEKKKHLLRDTETLGVLGSSYVDNPRNDGVTDEERFSRAFGNFLRR